MLKAILVAVLFWVVGAGYDKSHSGGIAGNYNPEEVVANFRVIGQADLGTDKSGNVPMIFGTVINDNGDAILYEAMFTMCDATGEECGNILIRHIWPAERTDVWCIIDHWDNMPQYKDRARASPSSGISLIREQTGFNGYNRPPLWLGVQLWKKELIEFYNLTLRVREICT